MIYSDNLEVFNEEVEVLRKKAYLNCYNRVKKYVKSGKVLDIGAAYGTGSNLFREKGFLVEALEPEINKINYLRNFHKLKVITSSIEEYVTRKRNYDLIIFSSTLEHVDYPEFVIKKIGNLLKKGGVMYLEIPILWHYVNWNDALYLPHKSNFTEENIIDLLRHSGLEILDKKYLNTYELFHGESSSPKQWDLGIILKYGGENKKKDIKFSKGKHTIADVLSVYRKDLPLKNIPPNKVLKYSVPYIENFFQTLILGNYEMIGPQPDSDFITFKHK